MPKSFKKIFYICIVLVTFGLLTYANPLTLTYSVDGLEGKPKINVTDRLDTALKEFAAPLNIDKIHKFYQNAPGNIEKALEPYGYFHVGVHHNLMQNQENYQVNFVINPGPRVRVTSVTIELTGPGKDNPTLVKFAADSKSDLSNYLNTIKYEKIKDQLLEVAHEQGFLDGQFTKHTIQINRDTNTAIIELSFNTGKRYYVGTITFSKNPLSAQFLRRYLPFHEGDPFSPDKLLQLQSNLNSTIYYKSVAVTANTDEAKNNYIPVKIKLTPNKPHQYSFGLGYGTDTGARASMGWEWRYLNQYGHYFQAALQLSQKMNNSFQARYVIPGKNPMKDTYNIIGGFYKNQLGDDSRRYTLGQVGANYVTTIHGWQSTYSLELQREHSSINNIKLDTFTVFPNMNFQRIKANDRINTSKGYRLYFNFGMGAVDKIKIIMPPGLTNTGSPSFAIGEFQGKFIHSFHKQDYRIILRTDLGATYVKNFNAMPLSQKFVAGGSQSIRGFDYQTLGPGRYLIVGSSELQRRLCKKFYGAIFFDGGNALRNIRNNFKKAYGIGLLYRSPVGPLEVTVAHPTDEPFKIKHGFKIQFTMGPDL